MWNSVKPTDAQMRQDTGKLADHQKFGSLLGASHSKQSESIQVKFIKESLPVPLTLNCLAVHASALWLLQRPVLFSDQPANKIISLSCATVPTMQSRLVCKKSLKQQKPKTSSNMPIKAILSLTKSLQSNRKRFFQMWRATESARFSVIGFAPVLYYTSLVTVL